MLAVGSNISFTIYIYIYIYIYIQGRKDNKAANEVTHIYTQHAFVMDHNQHKETHIIQRDRERDRERDRHRERECVYICVYVCVCVRERERQT